MSGSSFMAISFRRYVLQQPNAGGEPLPKAGARHERTLEAVGSTAWFGAGCGRDWHLLVGPVCTWGTAPHGTCAISSTCKPEQYI
jgi:hypothetical protein